MEIPEVGKTYNCFDDGKVKKSRLYRVTVKSVIPFDKIDSQTRFDWDREVVSCPWLYALETDYFIKSVDEDGVEEIFVRTKDDGWFSIGGFLNAGRLDVSGSLTKWLNGNV